MKQLYVVKDVPKYEDDVSSYIYIVKTTYQVRCEMYKNMTFKQNMGWLLVVFGATFLFVIIALELGVPH